MDDVSDKRLMEAALYVANRPLRPEVFTSILKTSSKAKIKSHLKELVEEYDRRDGALEIAEFGDGRVALKLKTGYADRVKELKVPPLLNPGPLKTLAYIAYNQPVLKSQVSAVRGTQAYSHVRELNRLGLISKEKLGRTDILRTSEVFSDYFDLSHDGESIRNRLNKFFKSHK